MYAWIIDKDHIHDPEDKHSRTSAGVMGPRDATREDIFHLMNGEGEKFQMYDDDGILYYSGRQIVTGETTRDSAEAMFAPLDDFGGPNAGAVTIRWEWDEWRVA